MKVGTLQACSGLLIRQGGTSDMGWRGVIRVSFGCSLSGSPSQDWAVAPPSAPDPMGKGKDFPGAAPCSGEVGQWDASAWFERQHGVTSGASRQKAITFIRGCKSCLELRADTNPHLRPQGKIKKKSLKALPADSRQTGWDLPSVHCVEVRLVFPRVLFAELTQVP